MRDNTGNGTLEWITSEARPPYVVAGESPFDPALRQLRLQRELIIRAIELLEAVRPARPCPICNTSEPDLATPLQRPDKEAR